MIIKFEIDVPDNKLQDIMAVLAGQTKAKAAPAVKAATPAATSTAKPNPAITQAAVEAPTQPAEAETIQVSSAAPSPAQEVVQEPVAQPQGKTLEDIRNLVMQIKPESRSGIMQDVFNQIPAAKLSDLPPDKYDWVYQAFEQAAFGA
jgi:hypothetical protein